MRKRLKSLFLMNGKIFPILFLDKKLQNMAHLTQEQRYTISVMIKQDHSQADIARTIGKCKSVVCRELKRNCDKRNGEYRYDLAQRKYEERMKNKPKSIKLTGDLKEKTLDLLKEDFSPEQIHGRLKSRGEETVSPETIYSYVWDDKAKGGKLYLHLRCQGRKYRKRGDLKDSRGIIKNRVSIDKRPELVEKKNRFGDLEGDLIIGKNHQQAIVTINDRSAGVLRMGKVKSKDAIQVKKVIVSLLEDWLPYDVRTLTLDNGKEFAEHELITENTGVDVYFAHPYSPWQRGANENLNGLIRQYLPKGTDFSKISDSDIEEIETKLNNRPRKRYNFDTPIERMEKLLFNKVAFTT